MSIHRTIARACASSALAGLILGISLAAQAGDDALSARVTGFLRSENAGIGDHISVTVNTPTARMPACQDPQPFLPGQAARTTGRITVGVRCPGDSPETRYVQADVRVYGRYYVASHEINSGDTLTAGDLESREGDITRDLNRLPDSESAIVGQQARRRIAESQTIVSNMLEAPDVISRGDSVKVVSKGPGFSITTHGKALDNATAGANVRVRTSNGTVVSGKPDGPGVVVVSP
ncbi:flagellar basal body P-ring formation chaperone FlgA [Salinisphaera hydrothermalis]|uniref:Flagella basal body P-ring formation protein FlgA n=1 Tax=Salinisphaera hydrothermalis (strain C41B8) TaxID=1304275 RepID=A0A084IMV2_SALHC|nr:flagellar basal body P-ring formation chaperone FlgA [Salinisphaera hydrothermalis]KEZ78036.1 flagellar basal body P-ring biosynthesis protein FlgA [Salinisphaera hydrothermalis C41B8]